MFSGILEAGETERLTPRFEDGVAFQVVGVCDTDCSDLEIEATESGMWEIVATAYEKGMWGEYALEVSVEGASGGASIGTAGGVRRETGSLAPGDETLRIGGPQSGFQHFVADRGSIGPDEIIFR